MEFARWLDMRDCSGHGTKDRGKGAESVQRYYGLPQFQLLGRRSPLVMKWSPIGEIACCTSIESTYTDQSGSQAQRGRFAALSETMLWVDANSDIWRTY